MLLQKALLAASRRPGLRRIVVGNPATRSVVHRVRRFAERPADVRFFLRSLATPS